MLDSPLVLCSVSPGQSGKADRVMEQRREVAPFLNLWAQGQQTSRYFALSWDNKQEAIELVLQVFLDKQSPLSAPSLGSTQPAVQSFCTSPLVGRIKQTLSGLCTRGQGPHRLPRAGHFPGAPASELPRPLCCWALSPHQAARRKKCKSLLWRSQKTCLQMCPASSACWPKWPLLCSREVAERDLERGRHQQHTCRPPAPPWKVWLS